MTSDLEKEITERPEPVATDSHLDHLLISTNIEEPWYKSIVRGIRETIHPPELPPLELTSRPIENSQFGDLAAAEQPWFKSLFTNIK